MTLDRSHQERKSGQRIDLAIGGVGVLGGDVYIRSRITGLTIVDLRDRSPHGVADRAEFLPRRIGGAELPVRNITMRQLDK
ncbi:MAG: hypothetical protein R3C05_18065, partial [Pirellulaceae bacterium]